MSVPRSKAPDDDRLFGYLLGRLTEDEQERVESFYFGDGENLELLAAAEDELIDSYVRGELGPRERERFEDFFLRSPERRERVENARALDAFVRKSTGDASAVNAAPPTHARFKRASFWLPLAACLLLTAGCAFLVYRMLDARRADEPAQSRIEDANRAAQPAPQQSTPQQSTPQQPDAVSRETASRAADEQVSAPPSGSEGKSEEKSNAPSPAPRPTAPRHTSAVASILLTAGASRGGGPSQTLTINRGAERVRLLAEVGGRDYQSYEALLRTAEGREVWRGSVRPRGLEKGAGFIVFTPPARVFRGGDYTLSVTGLRADGGTDAAGEYQFRVSSR